MTEDQLEQEALGWLTDVGYTHLYGPDIAHDGSSPERANYRQVVLPFRLREAINRLNPNIPTAAREDAFKQVTDLGLPVLRSANQHFHRLLVTGVPVQYQQGGETRGDFVRLIDWAQPERNEWLAVNQFSIRGPHHTRRPDVILFVNGLPLVLIELKNPADLNADGNALAHATATDKLLELLETRYQTHAALLADMQAMAVDLGAFDTDYPADLLYEELPLSVADAYMAARHGRSLDAAQLATLVWWHTGWLTDAQTLQPLAHKLRFETVVHVLIDTTLAFRKNGRTVTSLALLRDLYAAA